MRTWQIRACRSNEPKNVVIEYRLNDDEGFHGRSYFSNIIRALDDLSTRRGHQDQVQVGFEKIETLRPEDRERLRTLADCLDSGNWPARSIEALVELSQNK